MRGKVAVTASGVVAVFVLAATLVHAQQSPQSKRRVVVQEIDFVFPDVEAFAGLAELSDAVTSVEILSRKAERRMGPGGSPQDILTAYTLPGAAAGCLPLLVHVDRPDVRRVGRRPPFLFLLPLDREVTTRDSLTVIVN